MASFPNRHEFEGNQSIMTNQQNLVLLVLILHTLQGEGNKRSQADAGK